MRHSSSRHPHVTPHVTIIPLATDVATLKNYGSDAANVIGGRSSRPTLNMSWLLQVAVASAPSLAGD